MNNLFQPFDAEAATRKYRRRLPHWRQDGATYFVTFRTADSVPQHKVQFLKKERKFWLKQHPPPWTPEEERQYHQLFEGRVQKWLDRGYGACPLRRSNIGKIVADALRHFDGDRYHLDEFIVMPNHVHALLKLLREYRLSKTLHSWKSYSANKINGLLGLSGQLWYDESFDHIVRRVEHLEGFRRYIRANPFKAGLQPGEFHLGKGSGLLI